MKRVGIVFVAVVIALSGAASDAATLTCPNVLRVAVLKDGKLTVDGKAATVLELDTRLTALDKSNGTVWYYREDSHRFPSQAAEDMMHDVLDTLVKHKRPVSFSYNADYSDVIDDQGKSSPRTKC